MARSLRVEYPGAYYHVINSGNCRENVFKGAGDKKKYKKSVIQLEITNITPCGLCRRVVHKKIKTPRRRDGRVSFGRVC